MRVLTAEEMRRAEKLAVEAGSSYEALMEQAGQGAASLLLSRERARLEKEGLTALLGPGEQRRRRIGDRPGGAGGAAGSGGAAHHLPRGGALGTGSAEPSPGWERFGGRVERYTAEEAPETAFSGVILDGISAPASNGGLPDGIRPVLRAANHAGRCPDCPRHPDRHKRRQRPFRPRTPSGRRVPTPSRRLKPAHLFKSSRALCGETTVIPIGITGEMLAAAGGLIRMDKALVRDYLPPRTATPTRAVTAG